MVDHADTSRFTRIATLTLAAVYIVILMGGIVRASGAGMGCPDWPTCFGQWIPPTDEAQLPSDYHAIYAQRGYADTRFNPVKTWTEYMNRLVGASTGILVILTLWSARRFWRSDRPIFWIASAVLLLIGFQGWLGSAVVASNLRPAMITAHMAMAFVIVSLLIYAIARSRRRALADGNAAALPAYFGTLIPVVLGMSLLQITMGTQIRQAVDPLIAQSFDSRSQWREYFPIIFYVHRSFSSIILFTNLWMAWKLVRTLGSAHLLSRWSIAVATLIVVAILSGVSLDRLGFPAFVQPAHLLLANLIFGSQLFLYLAYRHSRSGSASRETAA